jgi:hypothetical protein
MSALQKEKDPINYLLKGIELLDVAMNQPQLTPVDLIFFNFDIKLEHKINNDLKVIIVVIYVDLFNKEKSYKFGSISASCIFEVQDFEKFFDSKKNELNFPEDFLISINSIAISTTRGIMFSQFKGTYLHNAFLPIIDPRSFIVQK